VVRDGVKRHSGSQGSSFTVLFTSLSIILLAFFILLTSMAVPDEQRRIRAYGSLGSAFGLFDDGESSIAATAWDVVDAPVPRGGADAGDVEQIAARFTRRIAALGGVDGVEVQRGRDDWSVRLAGELLFSPEDGSLSAAGRRLLQDLVPALHDFPGVVRVAGHSDGATVGSHTEDPWRGSAEQAIAVMRYLHESGGVPRARLVALGYGPYWPIADNDTEEGRRRNRRVEITLVGAAQWHRDATSGGEDGEA
jgi:flagellar motor protein MotB